MRGGTGLDFLAASPLEILKIGSQAQVQVLLFGEFLTERVRLCGGDLGGGGAGFRTNRRRILDFLFHLIIAFEK